MTTPPPLFPHKLALFFQHWHAHTVGNSVRERRRKEREENGKLRDTKTKWAQRNKRRRKRKVLSCTEYDFSFSKRERGRLQAVPLSRTSSLTFLSNAGPTSWNCSANGIAPALVSKCSKRRGYNGLFSSSLEGA